MGEAENQANYILPPVAANISVVATSTASAATAIPSYLRGRYVSFLADGTDVYLAFGIVSTTIDETATGAGAATLCIKLPSDQEKCFKITGALDTTITHFILKAASGTPKVRIWASSPASTNAANSSS